MTKSARCNKHLLGLGQDIKASLQASNLIGYQFGTVGVSDGISMGTRGMLYSLQSRDLIADQVETAAGGHWLDGMVVVPGCDKNMPGVLMARQYLIFSLFAKDFTAILQYSRTVESTRTNGLWWYHSGWLMCWTATIRHCFCIPVVWEVSTRWKTIGIMISVAVGLWALPPATRCK